MPNYLARVVDRELERALSIAGAVNLVGPRACGKTTTGRRFAASSWQLDPSQPSSVQAAELGLPEVLAGPTPRLIDEWQLAPALWDAVRRRVDDAPGRGQFLLSGSAWPEDDARRHTGAGRILDVVMRPMSLFESRDSSGSISLGELLRRKTPRLELSLKTVFDYAQFIARGGWPGWIDLPGADAQILVSGYLEALAQREFGLVGGRRRAPQRFLDFVRAYASLTAHPTPLSTVGKRLADDGIDVGRDYPGLYHDFATRMFIVEDQPAWSGARRSRTRLVANPKRHLIDPSLAASALGLSPAGMLSDLETFGLLFESLVIRDLRVYAQASDAKVLHYRTADATSEIDAVVEGRDGAWLGIEVKLGYRAAEQAAARLAEVAKQIMRPPAALAVVVAEGTAHQLDNGVWILPLDLLGP